MTFDQAKEVADSFQAYRPDIWTNFVVEPHCAGENGFAVKRIRFCMVELVAR